MTTATTTTDIDDQPSDRAVEAAARVWCDPSMSDVVMDTVAAYEIARIIDRVIASHTASDERVAPEGTPA